MNRDIVWTSKFKKDYKLAIKRRMDINLLDDIIRALAKGENWLATGWVAGSVTSSPTGCSSIASRIMCWC